MPWDEFLKLKMMGSGDQLPTFIAQKSLSPFISDKLEVVTKKIYFKGPTGKALGYNALILPEICSAYMKARNAGALKKSQLHIADRCEVLMLGFAHIGIIALVDEVTGFQETRGRNALARILEEYLDKELQPWTRTFPIKFYKEIYRLKKWAFPESGQSGKKPKTPGVIGKITKNIVYKTLPHGVLEELQKKNPYIGKYKRATLHTQWFNPEKGHPKLITHLEVIMSHMKICKVWNEFIKKLKLVFPHRGDQMDLDIDD